MKAVFFIACDRQLCALFEIERSKLVWKYLFVSSCVLNELKLMGRTLRSPVVSSVRVQFLGVELVSGGNSDPCHFPEIAWLTLHW